jgi:hypothetical protein
MASASVLSASLLLCLALASGADAARKMVGFYELKNKKGDFSVKVTNWGAALARVIVPDSKGAWFPSFPRIHLHTVCFVIQTSNLHTLLA